MSYFIPCEIDGVCASLEHTWLKNRLLAQLRANRELWIRSNDGLPSALAALPNQLAKVRMLIRDLYEGFSPSQLVERVPLSPLLAEVRTLIKNAVHSAYLELGLMQPLVEELTSATDHFEVVAAKIAACWQDGPEMRSQVIDDLELAAIRLRTAFLALPREVVLP